MKRISSFQLTGMVKSFTLFFFCFTFLWGLGNYIAIRDVLISWPVFIVNIILSLGFGYWYYRQRYLIVFLYNQDGFELIVGKHHTAHRWSEFKTVSLCLRRHGEFVIRLYETDDSFIEIPASALRLNARDFRFEVMDFVKGLAKQTEQGG
jgi:hypothetical protein